MADTNIMDNDDEIVLRVDIESAMRLKNPWNELEPPTSSVQIKMPFKNCNPEGL